MTKLQWAALLLVVVGGFGVFWDVTTKASLVSGKAIIGDWLPLAAGAFFFLGGKP